MCLPEQRRGRGGTRGKANVQNHGPWEDVRANTVLEARPTATASLTGPGGAVPLPSPGAMARRSDSPPSWRSAQHHPSPARTPCEVPGSPHL